MLNPMIAPSASIASEVRSDRDDEGSFDSVSTVPEFPNIENSFAVAGAERCDSSVGTSAGALLAASTEISSTGSEKVV